MARPYYDLLGFDQQLGAARVMSRRRDHRASAASRSPSTARPVHSAAELLMLPQPSAADVREDLTSMFPGVPRQTILGWPLPFSQVAFTDVSGTVLQALANPQRPIKANRMVIDVARTGATSTGLLSISLIKVGTTEQSCGNGLLPVSMFANNATDVVLDLMQAQPGIQCIVEYSLAAPALVAPDTIQVATAWQSVTAG